MKKEQVPQDNSRTYAGHKKVIYATNTHGGYEKVESNGWEPEELATILAVDELERLTADARQRVRQGLCSPLAFYMYHCRYDLSSLAQTTGFYKWQIKRHLRLEIFSQLPKNKLDRYANAFGITVEKLKQLPA